MLTNSLNFEKTGTKLLVLIACRMHWVLS